MTDATTAPPPTDSATNPELAPATEPATAPGALPVAAPAGMPPAAGAAAVPSILGRLPLWTVPALLLAVPLLAWLIAQVVPAFYDNVIWQYYWGPIKADAQNVARLTHDGIVAHSGYNIVNTLSWAVLLGVCILGIAQMLTRLRTPMDAKLIIAATAWVVVGSVVHVLEDTGLMLTPLQYFFITPPIYLLFGAFGIGSFLIGQWLKRVEAKAGLHAALRMLWLVHVVLVLLWTGLWLNQWGQITIYVNPLWVAGMAVVSFFVARHFIQRTGHIDPSQLTLTLSLGTFLLAGAYVISFLRDPWMLQSDSALHWSPLVALALAAGVVLATRQAPRKALLGVILVGGSLGMGVIALVLVRLVGSRLGFAFVDALHGLGAVAVVLAVAALAGYRWFGKLKPQLPHVLARMGPAYALPINLLIVFGQMVDGFATSLGIDLAGYEEKHVLSSAIIDQFRTFSVTVGFDFGAAYPTFIAFATVKLLVSLLVIFAIDVYSKDDAEAHPTMIGLVKFAIIMVGIGPGVRDFVRLAIGV